MWLAQLRRCSSVLARETISAKEKNRYKILVGKSANSWSEKDSAWDRTSPPTNCSSRTGAAPTRNPQKPKNSQSFLSSSQSPSGASVACSPSVLVIVPQLQWVALEKRTP